MIWFVEILKTVLIGIVQGITEWLPISSTGHMIIVNELVQLNVTDEFWEMFEVVIQFGSILAVIVLFFGKLNPFSTKGLKRETLSLWGRVIVAAIPAAVIGIPLDDWFDEHFYNSYVVAVALVVYGIAFIVIERMHKNKQFKTLTVDDITYKEAVGIGLFQTLSLVPGTSRSGSTIIGASLLGVSRTAAAEFSFFLAIPVMLGASLLKIAKYFLIDQMALQSFEIIVLLVGCAVAFAVSLVAIKFLMSFVKRHSFEAFGWYRIILGIAVIAYFAFAK